MNLYLRLLILLITSRFKHKLLPLDSDILTLRTLPNDLDINRHMNNGRYLSIMDLGRMSLMQRTGLLGKAINNKWMPIVGTAKIDFKRPLKLFQSYQLETRITGWDEKWFYLEQRFTSNNKDIAIGFVKGLLRGREGNIEPQHIIELLGHSIQSPVLSDNLKSN